MLILAILCSAALAMGVATAWLLRTRKCRWPIAVLAGLGVTLSAPFCVLALVVLFPPLGILVGGLAMLGALKAFDDGRIWVGTGLTAVGALVLACAKWLP